jgi:hypothetical protein
MERRLGNADDGSQSRNDVRNGKLIRELNDAEAQTAKLQQAIARKNAANANSNPDSVIAPALDSAEIYVSEVPAEFRRVELFVTGTVPNKVLLPTGEEETAVGETVEIKPSPTNTPFTTWQEQKRRTGKRNRDAEQTPDAGKRRNRPHHHVMICPLTECAPLPTVRTKKRKPSTTAKNRTISARFTSNRVNFCSNFGYYIICVINDPFETFDNHRAFDVVHCVIFSCYLTSKATIKVVPSVAANSYFL